MPEVVVVYWRDIPAQVIVGKGRRSAKRQLPPRFEQAIDRAAMKVGLVGSDAYLTQWRKGAPYRVEGDPAVIVQAEAAQIEARFDGETLGKLIDGGGCA
ncbi:MAG: virulence factor [Rhodobacteraceae bacterium]|nr:virulence factor [Paracoccaceae bacterium]